MQIYDHSSSTLLVSDSIIKGYDDIVTFFKKNYSQKADMGQMYFSDISIKRLSSEYAMAIGKWSLKRDKGSGGIFTVLYKKTPEGWKIGRLRLIIQQDYKKIAH